MKDDIDFLGMCIRITIDLLLILVAWQFVLVPTFTDALRQRVFSIRRKMFLYMANGNIAANDPAYRELRERMNAILQFANKLTWLRCLLMRAALPNRKQLESNGRKLKDKLSNIPDEAVKMKMNEFKGRFEDACVYYLFKVSMPGMIITLPIIIAHRIQVRAYRQIECAIYDLWIEHKGIISANRSARRAGAQLIGTY